MRNLCDIFRKLAGNPNEFKEGLLSLYEDGSVGECDSEMREHIKNCHKCQRIIENMKGGDRAFIGTLLNIDINQFERVRK